MKNLLKSIFCLVFLTSFSSCGSDVDDPLEGTWTAVSFSVALTTSSQEFSSTTDISALNLDYNLTFEGSNFSTSGSYDVISSSTITPNEIYSDISKSGTYSFTETELIVNGSFYSFKDNGRLFQTEEAQDFDYEINANGELVLSQNEILEQNNNLGFLTWREIVSSSRWVRK